MATRFDFDVDGRLNTAEKENCLKEVKAGFEKKLYWVGNERAVQVGGQVFEGFVQWGDKKQQQSRMTLGKLQQRRKDEFKNLYEQRLQKLMDNGHYVTQEVPIPPKIMAFEDPEARKPKIGNAKTKVQLERLRKEITTQELIKNSNPAFISGDKRLEARENALFRMNEIEGRKTLNDIKAALKKEKVDNYESYYQKKAIEEKQLPKYSEH